MVLFRYGVIGTRVDIYVSLDGLDTNPGTSDLPLRTLQKAADAVEPGDIVTVRPGEYKGFMIGYEKNAATGVPGRPIIFRAEPGVFINAKAKLGDGINIEKGSWITIEGFTVKGMKRAGIRAAGGGSNIFIRNNVCSGNSVWGIFTSHIADVLIENNVCSGSLKEHGIYHSNSGDRPIIRGNTSFGNKGCGIHVNGDKSQGGDGLVSNALIEGNTLYGNGRGGGSAINCDGVINSVIRGNILYGNLNSGISLFRYNGATPSHNNVVEFNTIVNSPLSDNAALNIKDGSTGTTVTGNILLSSRAKEASYLSISDDSLEGYTSDYNIVSPNVNSWTSIEAWRSKTGQDAHSMISNPVAVGFANLAANDYRLLPTSIAVGAAKPPSIGAHQCVVDEGGGPS